MKTQLEILSPARIIQKPQQAFAGEDFFNGDVQPDLLYMDSVLVSTGQNANTDVFLPDEMWRARHTPKLKPVDWEHQTGRELNPEEQTGNKIIVDNQIIGMMYNSYAVDRDGRRISESITASEDFQIPEDFDIINEAVIFKYLFPNAAKRIVAQANEGSLFVSMEAWFTNFDYRLGNKIVARKDETAFLDKHLRANGGDGVFNGETLGRVLRNIVFGGVGVVARPANKASVIRSFTNADLKECNIVNSAIASNVIGKLNNDNEPKQEVISIMSDVVNTTPAPATSVSASDYQDVVKAQLKAELSLEKQAAEIATANENIARLQSEKDALVGAFAEGANSLTDVLGADATAKLASVDAKEFFTTLASLVTDKVCKIDELSKSLAEANKKLEEQAAAARLSERYNAIADALHTHSASDKDMSDDEKKKKDEEKKERFKKFAKSTEHMSDEDFAEALALLVDTAKASAPAQPAAEEPATAASEGITDTAVFDAVRTDASELPQTDNSTPTVDLTERMKSLASALLCVESKDKEE